MKKKKIAFLSLLLTASLLVGNLAFPIYGQAETGAVESVDEITSELESGSSEAEIKEESEAELWDEIVNSQWYQNGYDAGLYRNQSLNYTVGWKYQNETISDILRISEFFSGTEWSTETFFEGTIFQALTLDDLRSMQNAGIEELDIAMIPMALSFNSSYTLDCKASTQFKNFSMDIYDDDHGTLYLLNLGDHNAFCIDYGKHSPKGTTYNKVVTGNYLSSSQLEVIKQGLMYFLWLENSMESGNKSWGTATDITDFSNTSGYYLYMQIWVWGAMKGLDSYGCADIMRDTLIDWSSSNASWANGYYNWAKSFLDNKLYEKYDINVSVYSSGNSSNQNMFVYDISTLSISSKEPSVNRAQIIKSSTSGERLTDATFTLYQWNGSGYSKVKNLSHSGNGVYDTGVVLKYNAVNQGKWRIQETGTPADHVASSQYVDFNIAEELVKSWYRAFFGREPDSAGLSSWTSDLISGSTEYEVMRSIALSSEANKKIDAVFIQACYAVILIREPTSANLTYWKNCLNDGTYNRTTMFDFFWNHNDHQNGVLSGTTARVTLSYSMTNTKYGYIQVTKTSSDTSVTDGNSNYTLQGAVYGVYSNSGCTLEVTTITIGSNGVGKSGLLAPGTYYVKEKTPSKGYTLNTSVTKATVPTTSYVNVNSEETPVTGSIKLLKTSTVDVDLSLQGAVYGVYSDSVCTKEITTLITDKEGKASVSGLPLGTYYVKEKKAPEGFELDTVVHKAVCNSAAVVTVCSQDEPSDGYVNLEKRNSDPEFTNEIPYYSLLGARFGVYKTESEAKAATAGKVGNPVCLLTTVTEIKDPDHPSYTAYRAKSETEELKAGTYYMKELEAPPGFYLRNSVYSFEVKAGFTTTVILENDPRPLDILIEDELSIHITKTDSSGNSLKGSTFLIELWNTGSASWEHPYQHRSDPEVAALSNERETDTDGKLLFNKLLPGLYRITETSAPDGYSLLGESVEVELPIAVSSGSGPAGAAYSQDGYDYFFEYELTVTDGQLIAMPFTGGNGIYLPVISGYVAIFAGGYFLFRKKKMF